MRGNYPPERLVVCVLLLILVLSMFFFLTGWITELHVPSTLTNIHINDIWSLITPKEVQTLLLVTLRLRYFVCEKP